MPHAPPFLCESCGYDLSRTPPAGPCPECGVPVARSMSAARPGSPFQQRAGVRNWLVTAARALWNPRKLFRESRVDDGSFVNFFLCNALAMIALLFGPFLCAGLIAELRRDPFEGRTMFQTIGTSLVSVLGAICISMAVLFVGYGIAYLIVNITHRMSGARRDTRACDIIVQTSSAVLLVVALASPLAWLSVLIQGHGRGLDAIIRLLVLCAFVLWVRIVLAGLRELRFANPHTQADDADKPISTRRPPDTGVHPT